MHAQYAASAVTVAFVDDCDPSGDDDEEFAAGRAFCDQNLAGVHRSAGATDLERCDLFVCQAWECSCIVRCLVVDRQSPTGGCGVLRRSSGRHNTSANLHRVPATGRSDGR